MKRLLSIITALTLCLMLCPAWALAAEGGGKDSHNTDDTNSDYKVEPDTQLATFQMTRAVADEIDMSVYSAGFVFANGIPIVIKQNGDITSIYDTDSNLLTGENDVSNCYVFGGWYNSNSEEQFSNTSIVMESGTVQELFGGCYGGTLNGNTSITVSGDATVKNVLFGGGSLAATHGNTSITVDGGTVNTIYGGNNKNTLTGNTSITLNDCTVGWVYGGGYDSTQTGTAKVTINSGAKVWGGKLSDPSSEYKGTVFGGGKEGSVTSTEVIFNGGDMGWIYGGGENCACTGTHVKIMGQAEDFVQVYAGGLGGTIGTAVLEFHGNASSSNNKTMILCGSGWYDAVDKVEIIIGSDSKPGGAVFYAKNMDDSSSTVGSASFDLSLKDEGVAVVPQAPLNGEGVTGKVSAYIHGQIENGQGYGTQLAGIDELIIDSCQFSLNNGMHLDRLEVRDSATIVFSAFSQQVTLGELAGSGTIRFSKLKTSSNPLTVKVDKISIPAGSRMKIECVGAYFPQDERLNTNFFEGPGVEQLESAACFVSSDDAYNVVKTENNTIKLEQGDGKIQTYLTPPYTDQSTYRYGDTINITLGLHTYTNGNRQPFPGAEVEIRTGSQGLYRLAATTMGEDGTAVISLPVNDAVWSNQSYGFQAIYWGDDTHKSNEYGVSTGAGDYGMSVIIEKAAIELDGEIIAVPVYGATPISTFDVGENEFYTAEVIWSPADAAFQFDTPYTASIRLIPKAGYSLDADRIATITYGEQSLPIPETEPDGSLILSDVLNFNPIPGVRITLTAEPAEGGSVSGGGIFETGRQVTVTATPAENYVFDYWTENGERISDDPEYTITTDEGNRNLTAVFHTHDWRAWESADEDYHIRTCTVCGIPETGEHEYDGDTDASCNVCGYERALPSEEEPSEEEPPEEVRTKIEQSELTEVPEGLKDTEFDTVKKITNELSRILVAQAGYTSKNMAFYDVVLMVSTDGGEHWEPATKENFPAKGLTILLPYPKGTGQKTHDFVVTHMFTTDGDSWHSGDTERPAVTKTEDGIQFTVKGLSPIAVAWKEVTVAPTPTPTPTPTPAPTPTPPGSSSSSSGSSWSGSSTYSVIVQQMRHGSVTANRTSAASGNTVTLTVTPDDGYMLDALTVTQSQGSEIKLTGLGGGKYTFTMPSRAVIVAAVFVPLPEDVQQPCDGGADCPSHGFTDLGGVDVWYHEAVDYVLRNGLMNGIDGGLFGPENLLTRAQIVQILYNKEGQPAVTNSNVFADVAPGQWYTPAVTWAAGHGFANGYGNGLFGPDDKITREQLAVILWRYAGNPAATKKELNFLDADEVSGYALEALRWAVENGVINGKGGGILDPEGYATRADTAQMLMNFMEKQ